MHTHTLCSHRRSHREGIGSLVCLLSYSLTPFTTRVLHSGLLAALHRHPSINTKAHLAIMFDIYPIRYPTKFLQKGEIAEEDTKFGFTNCFRIGRHIESLIIQYHLSGWKIGDIISNADEKTLEECKEKDGDLVAPTGGWVDLGLGFWVTAGCT